MLNILLRNITVEEQDLGLIEGVNFPLNSTVDMAALELKLREPEQEKKVVSYIINIYLVIVL